jgi:hypothetical protein
LIDTLIALSIDISDLIHIEYAILLRGEVCTLLAVIVTIVNGIIWHLIVGVVARAKHRGDHDLACG